ncbi:MAG: efflux RND transporter permease subunit, partial [Candidatus Omnitrophica bacterium]|nr:efflux RND transporter permease subunit [Candidatus Omnitrophota bacterium]
MMNELIDRPSLLDRTIRFCLENTLVVGLLILFFFGWGLYVMPFEWDSRGFPTNPVPVDAIPDIGENQQIVFTRWPGRSPQDVEDQVTYPMTVSMLGVPGVKEVRSFSMFGFSSVNVIFKEEVDFYWSRSRILEKLASAQKELPEGVVPELGPDATGLGQIFWYTLEGEEWGPEELRSIQDWVVNYALEGADGVSEVASVGGYVKEYQVDVDPDAMRAHRVTLNEIVQAVRKSNIDVGARTIEVNNVEYVVRGIGYLENTDDLMDTVIKENDNVPIYVRNVAHVTMGPALRRGVLDKEGAETVGGVAVVRYGENPLRVIKEVKGTLDRIGDREMVDGKETWVLHGYEKRLEDGTVSKIRLVPFYDRTQLINETLGTLQKALSEEILVTIIIVVVMLSHFMSSLLISSTLPFAVMIAFICMKTYGVDANIMSLSGIAIAIGTMVDMGIILCENIVSSLESADEDESRLEVIYRATSEVGSAVITAISTTVVSFLPVFTMVAAEGKLFKPLAYTKTFALIASVVVALTIIPTLAMFLIAKRKKGRGWGRAIFALLTVLVGFGIAIKINLYLGLLVILFGVYRLVEPALPGWSKRLAQWTLNTVAVVCVGLLLTHSWMPLGPVPGFLINFLFVAAVITVVLGGFLIFQWIYPSLLRFFLDNKWVFFPIPIVILLIGLTIWLGFDKTFGLIPKAMDRMGMDGDRLRSSETWVAAVHEFPGLGKEFMPPLDEGSFLYMPTTMTHAGLGECIDVLSKQDILINNIPEVDTVVGKIGRVESALDPAPISMVETIINYKPEWSVDPETGERTRNWRDEIKTPQDIWDEIVKEAQLPGSTAAPKLQPIETRLVMLQTGMRAPMG